ncbi:MAG: cytidine deaminase [Candidatus Paceibacterota bacterium]|jgi:cytidine deaminase
MTNLKYKDLNKEEKKLLDSAEKALGNAYNPYNSQLRVGASVQTKGNGIILGSSMANASSTVNMCAERAALAAANALGFRDITAMAIIGTDSDGVVENPIMPCGVCRQFMEEYLTINGGDIEIICSNSAKNIIVKTSLKKLLPMAYAGSGVK